MTANIFIGLIRLLLTRQNNSISPITWQCLAISPAMPSPAKSIPGLAIMISALAIKLACHCPKINLARGKSCWYCVCSLALAKGIARESLTANDKPCPCKKRRHDKPVIPAPSTTIFLSLNAVNQVIIFLTYLLLLNVICLTQFQGR